MHERERNFVLQQGLEDPDRDAHRRSEALLFQPRVIGPVVLVGMMLQSPAVFLGLAALLWWCALLPRANPFDALYNLTRGSRPGAIRLGPAPSPRRFAQGMAGTFSLAIGAALLREWWIAGYVLEGFFAAAIVALVFGRFIPVSTGGGEMFLTGAALETGGRWQPEVFLPLVDRVVAGEAVRLGRAPDPVEADRAMLRAGLAAWRHEPLTSLSIAAKRVYRLCFVPLSSEDRPGLRLAFLVALLALYALAVPEGLAGFRDRGGWPALRALLLVGVATYPVATSFFYTNSRYMEPVRPLLVVLAVGPVVRRLHRARPGGAAG